MLGDFDSRYGAISARDPRFDVREDVVARAMRLIADGVIDRDGVPGLAARLGYSVRQLERLLVGELGAGPLALARAQRAQTARTLIESTSLSMAEVAMAAGFASIRQFNDTVRAVFALTPTELRRRGARGPVVGPPGSSLDLRLPFRRPLCPENLFGHLAATAVDGVEEIRGDTYRRTLRLPSGPGVVGLTPRPDHVSCRLRLADLRDLSTAIARCRWLLDLDADPEAIDRQLALDPALTAAVAAAPGRRVPRTVDGAEMAIRAVVRPADLDRRGSDARRAAGRPVRRAGARSRGWAHPPVPGARGAGRRRAGHARRAQPDPEGAARGAGVGLSRPHAGR